MKFASVDGQRAEARPTLRGFCEECEKAMIAHCGPKRIWHWKHYRKSPNCWHENETLWHRAWKECFPIECQEETLKAPDGEKHKADIKIANGPVIEFQYSRMDSTERKKREDFYKDMAWVVNGTRLKRDYPRFCKGLHSLRHIGGPFYFTNFPEECFPADWLNSTVPVYFDFERNETNEQVDSQDKKRSFLFCLFPGRVATGAVVFRVGREGFIEFSKTRSHLYYAQISLMEIQKHITHKGSILKFTES